MINYRLGRRTVASALAVGGVATALALGTAGSSDAASVTYVQLRNQLSGLCVQTNPGAPASAGVQLVQEPCTTRANLDTAQLWLDIDQKRPGRLLNRKSSACLDVHGSYANFTPVDTWPCNGISNETWTYHPDRMWTQFTSHNNQCLDVAGGRPDPGTPIVTYHCDASDAAQLFAVVVPS